MNFSVIDVETANEDFASICQIGIATFSNGQMVDTWESLINPQDRFSSMNISIHGIYPEHVVNSPTIKQIYNEISSRLQNKIALSHTAFDRVAMERVSSRHNLHTLNCQWLDSAKVVRRTWPEFSRSGYGLTNLARHFEIDYKAHDALEDAICAAKIFLLAIQQSGITTEKWLDVCNYPISNVLSHYMSPFPTKIDLEGIPDGPYFGEVVVFTGELSVPRHDAAFSASQVGCKVESGVTKHTTILVVGCQDLRRLAGHEKSSKHIKAEMLIAKGQNIKIMTENEFHSLISY